MSLIVIDQAKCTCDGLCAKECPPRIISMESGAPIPIKEKEKFCIKCGHCVSVCPTGALTWANVSAEDLELLHPELQPGLAQVTQLLKGRRSVRSFKPEPVARELMAQILDTARYAPTGVNSESVRWIAIDDPAELKRIADITAQGMREMGFMPHYVKAYERGRDVILRNAPNLVINYASSQAPTPEYDCIIAMTYLEIAAASAGLGACWAGLVGGMARHYPPLAGNLGLPEGHTAYAALMLGQPTHAFARIPGRKPLKVEWR